MPRPIRLRSLRLCAGFSVDRFSFSAILDLHQVTDLPQHACEDGAVVVLDGLTNPAKTERPERAAVLLGFADQATNLSYSYLRHPAAPPPAACRGEPARRSGRASSPPRPGGAASSARR